MLKECKLQDGHVDNRSVDLLSGVDPKLQTTGRYFGLYFMFVITTVYIMVQATLEAVRDYLLSQKQGVTLRRRGDPSRKRSGSGFSLFVRSSNLVESRLRRIFQVRVRCGETSETFDLFEGETFLATKASQMVSSGSAFFVPIPGDVAVVIRVGIVKHRVVVSKLIFVSPVRRESSLRLFRQFGTDLIPIRLTENINVLTDTVQTGKDNFISFTLTRPS